MAKTGSAAEPSRLGGRPARTVRSGCAECGHPYALHSNGESTCKAFACTAGPDSQPCPRFVHQIPAVEFRPASQAGQLAS